MFLVFLVLGIMVSTQFRSAEMQRSHNINQQRAEDLVEKLKTSEKEKTALQERVKKLEETGAGNSDPKETFAMKMRAGEVTMQGPGVEVTLDDSKVPAKQGKTQTFTSSTMMTSCVSSMNCGQLARKPFP
ncbi:hypothetical protein M5E89_06285 [Acidaminococcus intestini]|nr:hypothetical protein M5E89_06285 [Acidaminococcus intestini]